MNLEQRMDKLQQELTAETNSETRTAGLMAVIGTILFVVLAGYFYYGYQVANESTQPKFIVDAAEEMIERKIPEVQTAISEEVKRSAPAWAEQISRQLRTQLPVVRTQAELYVSGQVEGALRQSTLMAETEFRKALRKNHDKLAQSFANLKNDSKSGEALVADLESYLTDSLSTDLRTHAQDVMMTLGEVNTKLRRLRDNTRLSPMEQIQRRIIMIARRMQADYLLGNDDPSLPISWNRAQPKAQPSQETQPAAKPLPAEPEPKAAVAGAEKKQ